MDYSAFVQSIDMTAVEVAGLTILILNIVNSCGKHMRPQSAMAGESTNWS